MEIINQPKDSNIGDRLKELLEKTEEDRFDNFYIMVAYVKRSGVSRLKPSILTFKGNGGQVKSIAGIDQKTSSKQGIKMLFELSDDMYIYYNRRLTSTFHPKVYIFEKIDQKAVVFIGSSNLTCGGLYTNYEMNSVLELDLTQETDREKFTEIKEFFNSYCNTSLDCCKQVSEELIQTLIDRDKLNDEDTNSIARVAVNANEEDTEGEPLFGTENFTAPIVEVESVAESEIQSSTTSTSTTTSQSTNIQAQPPPNIQKGDLVWKKHLTSSDVLYAQTTSTNVTGGLRLTQARWNVNGRRIDQTTYFKDVVFGNCNWSVFRQTPFQEVTDVLFNINILGQSHGQHRLRIRHKPSGESRQNNYTTLISWGSISQIISAQNLTGKDLFLYAPISGQNEPFYIEII